MKYLRSSQWAAAIRLKCKDPTTLNCSLLLSLSPTPSRSPSKLTNQSENNNKTWEILQLRVVIEKENEKLAVS